MYKHIWNSGSSVGEVVGDYQIKSKLNKSKVESFKEKKRITYASCAMKGHIMLE